MLINFADGGARKLNTASGISGFKDQLLKVDSYCLFDSVL